MLLTDLSILRLPYRTTEPQGSAKTVRTTTLLATGPAAHLTIPREAKPQRDRLIPWGPWIIDDAEVDTGTQTTVPKGGQAEAHTAPTPLSSCWAETRIWISIADRPSDTAQRLLSSL